MSWLLRVGVLLMGLLKQAGLVSTVEAGMPTTAREPVRNRTRERATPWRACALHVPPGTEHALEHVLELRPEKKIHAVFSLLVRPRCKRFLGVSSAPPGGWSTVRSLHERARAVAACANSLD